MTVEPITPDQRQIACETIRDYLSGPYRAAQPESLRLPAFRVELKIVKTPIEHGEHIARHVIGGHGDPTYSEAVGNVEGWEVPIPIMMHFPAHLVRSCIESFPTHLYVAVVRNLVRGEHMEWIADDEHVNRATIGRRVEEGVSALAGMLYGARWTVCAVLLV